MLEYIDDYFDYLLFDFRYINRDTFNSISIETDTIVWFTTVVSKSDILFIGREH